MDLDLLKRGMNKSKHDLDAEKMKMGMMWKGDLPMPREAARYNLRNELMLSNRKK